MAQSFSIPCSRFSNDADEALVEIRSHTNSDEEATSILRSIERFGTDPSIGHYEVTPTSNQRTYRGTSSVAWSVRAVRAELQGAAPLDA